MTTGGNALRAKQSILEQTEYLKDVFPACRFAWSLAR